MPRVRCRYHVQCSNRHVCACLWAGLFCDRHRLGSAFLDNDGDSSSESDDEVDAHYTLSTIRLKRNVSYKSADFEPGFTEYTKCILRRMFSCFDADADSAWNYAEARSFFSAVSTAELLEFDVVCGDDGAYRLSLWAQKFQTDIVGNLTFEGSGSYCTILGKGGGGGNGRHHGQPTLDVRLCGTARVLLSHGCTVQDSCNSSPRCGTTTS